MSAIPRVSSFDSTLSLITEGYAFISNRCNMLKTDVFEARIGLQPFLFMQGEEAARIFYDEDKFSRKDAAPAFVQKTLFGKGGVQGLDGTIHRHRKGLFMSLMNEQSINNFLAIMKEELDAYLSKWEDAESIILYDQLNEILFRSACQWAGITFGDTEVNKKTRDTVSMIEGPGTLGIRHWRGRMGRRLVEHWIKEKVKAVREFKLYSETGTVLHEMSWHRNQAGELLHRSIVAVEIVNIILPIVAIGRFITFGAVAMHHHPHYKDKIRQDGDAFVEYFVQEVRRFFPFFPFVVAKVRNDFGWRDYYFRKGTKVLLDLYGTNHHQESWNQPDVFNPERFKDWEENAYNFIPQGGGDHYINHRCAGEWLTKDAMKLGIKFLAGSMNYKVPDQDLSIGINRFPPLPKSRLVINEVKRMDSE